LEILTEAEQTFEKAKDGLDKAHAILIIACASARIAEANRVLAHAPLSLPFNRDLADCNTPFGSDHRAMSAHDPIDPHYPLTRLYLDWPMSKRMSMKRPSPELTQSGTFIQRQSGTYRALGRRIESVPFSSSTILGFSIFGRLAASTGVTRPFRVRLRYGSRAFALRGFVHSITVAHARSATCQMGNHRVGTFHPTRSARLSLAHRSREDGEEDKSISDGRWVGVVKE
jgi:hypothetical protein